ncbi:MAG: hypothetical protein HXY20_12750 [Acidobacteria bacterium]|nr:hypothetical protein [Acidobacteriota bacterium]
MKTIYRIIGTAVAVCLLTILLPAQERGGRDTPGNSSSGSSSISSRGIAASSSSATVSTTTSRDYSGSGHASLAMPSGGVTQSYTPDLRHTSFVSAGSYFQSLDFFYWVRRNYFLDRYYFSRFYRNTEPLITPQLARLTLRQPLALSNRLLIAVDELEALIRDAQAGKPADKQQIAEKTKEVRDLAKQLRQDQSLSYYDQRKERDLLKGTQYDSLGLEAIAQLREMALDLNNQIRSLYEQSSTSTVSVDSLAQPSFMSLSKGIDKLSRVISNSARRLS